MGIAVGWTWEVTGTNTGRSEWSEGLVGAVFASIKRRNRRLARPRGTAAVKRASKEKLIVRESGEILLLVHHKENKDPPGPRREDSSCKFGCCPGTFARRLMRKESRSVNGAEMNGRAVTTIVPELRRRQGCRSQ